MVEYSRNQRDLTKLTDPFYCFVYNAESLFVQRNYLNDSTQLI